MNLIFVMYDCLYVASKMYRADANQGMLIMLVKMKLNSWHRISPLNKSKPPLGFRWEFKGQQVRHVTIRQAHKSPISPMQES